MEYIAKEDEGKCIFCERAGRCRDREDLVVLRGRHAFVMMNRYPYTTGHLMIAPYRHVASPSDLTGEEACEVMSLLGWSERILRAALRPHGFNVGMNIGRCAGAGFPGHIHMHVVPRWEGDSNFMPVLSETKVLPETLTGTYDKIMLAREAEESKES
jgi:ATP adenylyltransferase